MRSPSITDVISQFLDQVGPEGATFTDIYAAVNRELRRDVRQPSVRSVVYKSLAGAKGQRKPRFERLGFGRSARYRSLGRTTNVS